MLFRKKAIFLISNSLGAEAKKSYFQTLGIAVRGIKGLFLPFMRSSRFLPLRLKWQKNRGSNISHHSFHVYDDHPSLETFNIRISRLDEADYEDDEEYGGDDEFLSVFVFAIVSC